MSQHSPSHYPPLKNPKRIYQILRSRHNPPPKFSRISLSLDKSLQRKQTLIPRQTKNRIVRSNPKKDSYPSLSTNKQNKSITLSSIEHSQSRIMKGSSKQYFLSRLRGKSRCFDLGSVDGIRIKKNLETLEPMELKFKEKERYDEGSCNRVLSDLSVEEILGRYGNKLSNFQKNEIKFYQKVYYLNLKQDQTKTINQTPSKILSKQSRSNWGFDNNEGCYLFKPHDHLAYRYQIVQKLGQGSFGQVLKCHDHKTNQQVAIKIIHNKKRYLSQSLIQIKILNQLKHSSPSSTKHIIQLLHTFTFRQHQCLVFQLLSINLYQLLKLNNHQPLPQDLIRRFALQILTGVCLLHLNSIIHCDLKPQNILLKNIDKSGLKIIDFGSSCKFNEKIYSYLQSRYYRAPQVIIGMNYNEKIDVWSLGCVFAELYLGYPLFPGRDEKEQIRIIVEIMGMPGKEFVRKCAGVNPVFAEYGKEEREREPKIERLIEGKEFRGFIKRCLEWDSNERASVFELVKSQWIVSGLPEDVRNQHEIYIKELQMMTGRRGGSREKG